jgi:cytochrome c-type biogenesis protein CcmH
MTAMVLALILAGYAPQQAGSALLDPPREARVQALGKQLRCPMCQGLSIADSNSSAARAQMDKVRELVAAGKTDQQIRDFFISRYGEWALLDPPASGMNLLVWVLPLLLLVGGGFAIARTMRRPTPAPATPAPGVEASKERPPSDDPYLEAVRAELRR